MAKAKAKEKLEAVETGDRTISRKSADGNLCVKTISVKIVGDSPYLPEPLDFRAIQLYEDKKLGRTQGDKDLRSEEEKVKERFYVCEDGKSYGIPVRAFKKSMIKASTNFFSRMEGGMRNVREGLTIVGDIAPLIYKSLTVNTSYVKPKNSPLANRRLRNQFNEWSCVLTIKFNENQISIEQIIAILNWAGFSNGVGGWRKECGGNYGSYKAIPLNMQE